MATYIYNVITLCCNLKLYFTLSVVLSVLRYPTVVLSSTGGAFEDAPVVPTEQGLLKGKRVSLNNDYLEPVDQYLGVPYAAPPTGNLRFRPPEPPLSWNGVRNATTFGSACLQLVKVPDQSTADMKGWKRIPIEEKWPFLRDISEDCLYLNIYVPTRGKKAAHTLTVLY